MRKQPWFRDALEMQLVPRTWEDLITQTGRTLGNGATSLPQEPATASRQSPENEMPEAALLGQILRLAKVTGWCSYHTHDSRKSVSGFPDLVLVKPKAASHVGRLIFAELKSKKGKVSEAQMIWLDVLKHSLDDLEVYEWRPADWPDIIEILTRK